MIRSELVTKLPEQLKGIFSMGSFLVSKSVVLQEERIVSNEGNMLLDIPIFMMHGM
jgi:predicted esterase